MAPFLAGYWGVGSTKELPCGQHPLYRGGAGGGGASYGQRGGWGGGSGGGGGGGGGRSQGSAIWLHGCVHLLGRLDDYASSRACSGAVQQL